MSILIELRSEAGPVLVVGGGTVATRKVRTLSEGEFRVTVIAPEVDERLGTLAWVHVEKRPFEDSDIDGTPPWALILACTDDRDVNARIGVLARARNIPVLVADAQAESTFFTPATLRDGELRIAVSTGGADPALAKLVRERIVAALGPGWARIVQTARASREQRLGRSGDDE